MSAEESLREGRLEEALTQLQEQVRKEPASSKYRIFLFQLLAVMGQWQRAMTQLGVLADMDKGALAMVQTYREALRCEVLRGEVFAGKRMPLLFGEPEGWVALMLEALRLTGDGHYAQSQSVRGQAFEAAPATSGTLDGQRFEWIADGDSRLGPLLEVIVNGKYYWVPFSRIQRIALEAPSDLRDVVWAPAHLTWANGGESPALIPTRYPGSENSPDRAICLARKTEWMSPEGGIYLGLGQRMLATDAGEYPLLEVREVTLDTVAGPSSAPGAGAASG